MPENKEKNQLSPERVKWMQRFFKVAGNIAPRTSIEILVKLLFTPQKRVLRPPHKALLTKAQKQTIKLKQLRKSEKSTVVKYYVWGTGERTVMLIHGWNAMALDYYKMIPVLVEQGYKVISIDGPGHGGSDGNISNLLEFKETLRQLIEKIGVPYALIGHSMGASASTYLLMEYDIRVPRLVQIAIPISSVKFFEEIFGMLQVPAKMKKIFLKEMEVEYSMPMTRLDLNKRDEAIKADKVLLIYDEDDEVVSLTDIKEFLRQRPTIQSYNAKGAGHNTIIRNAKVIEQIVDFLK